MTLAVEAGDIAPGPTRSLARFVCDLRYDALAEATRHAARRHILDTIGACVAGAREQVADAVATVFADAGIGGDVPVPGRAGRVDPLSAAYLAGASAHGLELDDGYRNGSVHAGAVVVPAALAAAYRRGASGRDLLTAVVAGYEVAARVSAAGHPRVRWRGFHTTSTSGVFGAAASVGLLHGLDEERLMNAFGLAASGAAGLFAFVQGGGDVKRLHPGHAAREGLLAALLAGQGLAGPPDVLEAVDGYFHAFAGDDPRDADYRAPDLFADWPGYAVEDCYIKPYACCRHIHPALDAMLEILNARDLAPTDVARVDVATYKVAAAHAAAGWENMGTAQLSFPFVMAVGLHKRNVDLDDFSEARRSDPDITGDCAKFHVTVDPECDANYPRLRPAKVRLTTTAGDTFDTQVDDAYGSPLNPMDDDALSEKYRAITTPVLGDELSDTTLARLWRLDDQDQIVPLADMLAQPV